MHLTAATLTVYFVGLIHFEGTQVVVPNAAESVTYQTEALVPHTASVVITGLAKDSPICGQFDGRWEGPAEHPNCRIGLLGKTITLPKSSEPFSAPDDGNFKKFVPKLNDLCHDGSFDPAYTTDANKYAALVKLEHGPLDACTNGEAWVPFLTLTDSDGQLSIGSSGLDKTATLTDGAAVWLINEPAAGISDHTPTKHFWWQYVMYNAESHNCISVPLATTVEHPACGQRLPVSHNGAASGPFCSPTQ